MKVRLDDREETNTVEIGKYVPQGCSVPLSYSIYKKNDSQARKEPETQNMGRVVKTIKYAGTWC